MLSNGRKTVTALLRDGDEEGVYLLLFPAMLIVTFACFELGFDGVWASWYRF